jgi:hypothetical protein
MLGFYFLNGILSWNNLCIVITHCINNKIYFFTRYLLHHPAMSNLRGLAGPIRHPDNETKWLIITITIRAQVGGFIVLTHRMYRFWCHEIIHHDKDKPSWVTPCFLLHHYLHRSHLHGCTQSLPFVTINPFKCASYVWFGVANWWKKRVGG